MNAENWQLLQRYIRRMPRDERSESLMVECHIVGMDGTERYRYLQHWLGGDLLAWEPARQVKPDLVIRRTLDAENRLWLEVAIQSVWSTRLDMFKVPRFPSWSRYPPRPLHLHPYVASDDAVSFVASVSLTDHGRSSFDQALVLTQSGSWFFTETEASCPRPDVSLETDAATWTRLLLARTPISNVSGRFRASGNALTLGLIQSCLSSVGTLSDSADVWPAVTFYEQYLGMLRTIDAANLPSWLIDRLRATANAEL